MCNCFVDYKFVVLFFHFYNDLWLNVYYIIITTIIIVGFAFSLPLITLIWYRDLGQPANGLMKVRLIRFELQFWCYRSQWNILCDRSHFQEIDWDTVHQHGQENSPCHCWSYFRWKNKKPTWLNLSRGGEVYPPLEITRCLRLLCLSWRQILPTALYMTG